MDGFNSHVQNKLDDLMPWIGMYIVVASAISALAMTADAVNGFRCKKFWFPCKYFSLNAISLTLLAVAMKLPMDLDTILIYSPDWFAKLCSLVFMSTAMANFVPSLGSMSDKEILANVVALGILVVTIVANVLSQAIQLKFLGPMYINIIAILLPTISMLLLLIKFIASAIAVPTLKKSLESKFQEKHKEALQAEERREALGIDNNNNNQIHLEMMKYWVMAETSNPQFVIARSVVCTTTTLFFLLPAIVLPISRIHVVRVNDVLLAQPTSVYGGYTRWILVIQSIGVIVGLIAPIFRWFVVVGFRCSTTNFGSFQNEFKIETHWTEALMNLRDNFSATQQIRQGYKCTKYLHYAKWLFLTIFIEFQSSIILLSKFIVLVSAFLISSIIFCFTHIRSFLLRHLSSIAMTTSSNHDICDGVTYSNLNHFVVLLEGESKLPKRIFIDICSRADNMIETGRKNQDESLLCLLGKFVDFKGVGEFDNRQIPSLHSQEPPNCWTLPIVTLTSIAIALPNISKDKRNQLVRSVSEGMSLAKTIEKTLNTSAELLWIRKAANISWVEFVLYMKWQGMDLEKASLKCKSSNEVLKKMSSRAERTIMEFKRQMVMENLVNWPVKVVAANSMYRITRTVLLSCDVGCEVTNTELFEGLSVMIADILAACLTNLEHVITTMCHRSAIEKREKSVRKAFLLFGKTERIITFLQQRKCTSLDRDKAAYIEEWHALFCQDNNDDTSLAYSEEHLAIVLDC